MEVPENGDGDANSLPPARKEEVMIGPGPASKARAKRPLPFEQAYLDALPSANMYEKSYMHRDVVTHVAVSTADFFITGSCDGHLKFWKKKAIGIEFAKHFRSHLGPIEGLASKMVGIDLKQEEKAFISSMYQQGIFDSHFDRMLSLRTRESPRFVVEFTSMFLNDGENNMAKKQSEIDYAQVSNYIYAQQLRGSSASIGGCQVSLACRELRFASDATDKDS